MDQRGQRLAQPLPMLLVPVVFQRAFGFRDLHSRPVAGDRSVLYAFSTAVPVTVNISLQMRATSPTHSFCWAFLSLA
jgi:hypothetical protein